MIKISRNDDCVLYIKVAQYLKEQFQNTMVVPGAYGRGRFSRWLRTVADILMTEFKVPLFIAHGR